MSEDPDFVAGLRRRRLTRIAEAQGHESVTCPQCKGKRHVHLGLWVDCRTCAGRGRIAAEVDAVERLGGETDLEYLDACDSLERLGVAVIDDEG